MIDEKIVQKRAGNMLIAIVIAVVLVLLSRNQLDQSNTKYWTRFVDAGQISEDKSGGDLPLRTTPPALQEQYYK
ncbi:hypothetical protein [Kiloniella majae]|uniref:hypothetical protein n=1 Tax=Kiloniella majae TaxID=1938558 RepID=UPI000A27802B|nr:hypothetical protein [Kiloniella majae]